MSERQFTKSCPVCAAIKPVSSPACLQCNYSFSPASVGQVTASYKKIISWIAGVLLALAVLSVAAVAGLLHAYLSSTPAYREALRLAKASPAVQAVLGKDIHLKSTALGVAFTAQGSEFVQFSVALSGSHGAGRLYAVANSIHQNLEFSRLSFLPAAGTQYIDLTPAPQRLNLPAVPAKKVYLIPIGWTTTSRWIGPQRTTKRSSVLMSCFFLPFLSQKSWWILGASKLIPKAAWNTSAACIRN